MLIILMSVRGNKKGPLKSGPVQKIDMIQSKNNGTGNSNYYQQDKTVVKSCLFDCR